MLSAAIGCIVLSLPAPARADSARQAYFRAESCYRDLQDDRRKQDYRHHWLRCIDGFQDVYRSDPDGPWAAAGMYMSGKLYYELYLRSGLAADHKESLDHFQRILKRFPDSGYSPKARTALQTARARAPAASAEENRRAEEVKTRYFRGEACYQELRENPSRQKYREAWNECIEHFEAVYRADPDGPWAAAGLYMSGVLNAELYDHSYRDADRQAALERFQRILQGYPDSAYRQRAASALQAFEGGQAVADAESFRAVEPETPDAAPATGAGPDPGEGNARVTGLRYWSNPHYTRLVIDADRETTFTYNLLRKDPSLNKPQRLYVDLRDSRLGENVQRILSIDDNLLKHARAGQYAPDVVRVVVDIKSLEDFEVFSLKEPFRIVMDIKGENGAAAVGGSGGADDAIGQALKKMDPKKSTSDLARQLALGVRRIVVDPGHGGRDYGAPGYLKGVHEKHIVLKIAKVLAEELRRELKCEVILTRNDDRYLTLEERTAFANTQNADLFISIHTNANRDRRAYGISTYFLNLADDDESKRVAAMENATSTNNISDLEKILFSLMHYSKINESSRLAAYVQESLTGHLTTVGWPHVKSKGVKQAPFYVLLGAQMPSILVETSFISNPRECRRLINPTYQKRLAQGIVMGVKRYIQDTHPTALQAPQTVSGGRG
jgi:N-acetylmuramoyl-L-alanine amidase